MQKGQHFCDFVNYVLIIIFVVKYMQTEKFYLCFLMISVVKNHEIIF